MRPEKPPTVFARLARRVEGPASWQDVAIAADWGALGVVWQTLEYDAGLLRAERAAACGRAAGRQGRSYGAAIVGGILRVMDVPPELWSLLAIGRRVPIGRGAGEGFGRFLPA